MASATQQVGPKTPAIIKNTGQPEGNNSSIIVLSTSSNAIPNNNQNKPPFRSIHSMQISQKTPTLKLSDETINTFKKNIEKNLSIDNSKDEQLTDNLEKVFSQSDFDLANILSQEDGIYSLLITEDNDQSLFIKVIETRIDALETYNQTKKNNKLKKHIQKLKSKLEECKDNPKEKQSLISLIDTCDEQNSLIGLSTKLISILQESKDPIDTTSSNCRINTIEKKGSRNTNLEDLDKLYRQTLVEKHTECITQIAATIASTESDDLNTYSSAVILPDKDKLKNRELLQLFIEQKPEIISELIYDRALIYTSIHNKIGVLNSKSKTIADKMLQSAENMSNTPESINKFLTELTSKQREYFIDNITSEMIEIQVKLVEKQLSLASSNDKISTKIQHLHACKRTINLLNNNYKPNNKNDKFISINKLTELLVTTKASIISKFLDMQYQLEEPTIEKKNADKQRIMLLKNLNETEILGYLQSTEDSDKLIQKVLNNIVGYVDYLSQYNNGEASKEQKIKLQNLHFDLLQSQQKLIDFEIFNMIPDEKHESNYKSKLIDAEDFNAMQKKLLIAYHIRRNHLSLFRISSNIASNFYAPHINYEKSGKALVEENLNEMIKESLGYNFWSMLKSVFLGKSSEKSNITLELEEKEINQLEEPVDKDSNFVFNSFKKLRIILHFKLQYILEVSKRNPALFRELTSQLHLFIPVLRHVFGQDVMLSTVLQDMAKKLNDSRFVDDLMKPKGDIPVFDENLKDTSDIALTMKKVMLLEEVLGCFNDYGLTVLSSISTLLPESSLLKVCETVSKETAKKGGIHLSTSITSYLFSAIKDNQAPTSNPIKSFLENYGFRWLTTYTRAFSSISKAVTDVIHKKPDAAKALLKEVFKLVKTFIYTALKTAVIVALISLPVFLFNISLPLLGIITSVIFIAAKVFHIQLTKQYGMTDNNLSLAIFADMFYNRGLDIDGHYNNPKSKKILQRNLDQLTRYDNTGSCLKGNENIKSKNHDKIDKSIQVDIENILQPKTELDTEKELELELELD